MAEQTATVRTVQDKQLPPAGRWAIDTSHSSIGFVARHMMISKVRGHFRTFSGTIHIAEVPEQSWVEATIDAASIDTGDADRDAHLRNADFLDVERFPNIRFQSTSVRPVDDKWEVLGDLTLRDVTRTVTLLVEFCGVALDPWGNTRAGFLAGTEINREDFSVTWNQVLEKGGFLCPSTADERAGQVANVCFAQSLVRFGDTWYLYYGMADSRIGCATAPATTLDRRCEEMT